MPARLLALLVVAAAPLSARAQDDNPYKDAKVGDFATFKMTMKVAGPELIGTVTSKVIAKTDKEATVEASGKMAGNDIPPTKQTIDLTKPFDPTKMQQLPPGTDAKVEKLKDGKEKLKVGDKSYETTWTTYKVTAKAQGVDIAADTKVWMSKDIPLGMAKMEMNAKVAGMDMVMTMELEKAGNEKK
ncbi:MAG TPA: hypothetical protein VMZ71_04450 [Gemmataceae bacterium]|nr:hypothetical protein [Gemmataceae bacterium]